MLGLVLLNSQNCPVWNQKMKMKALTLAQQYQLFVSLQITAQSTQIAAGKIKLKSRKNLKTQKPSLSFHKKVYLTIEKPILEILH